MKDIESAQLGISVNIGGQHRHEKKCSDKVNLRSK
jgi:hypothetical protein